MITHELIQGSPEWLAHRESHLNASDAPAMMGVSPYKTRNQLLHEMATGIVHEIDEFTQKRFDDGHRFERLARPIAEEIIGDDLYPIVGTDGKYSASFDGLNMVETIVWEHKTLNDAIRSCLRVEDLPQEYKVQMESQLLVSGAEKCLFMATQWNYLYELMEEIHFWYYPDPVLRSEIIAGWAQFEKDLGNYRHVVVVETPKAEPIKDLPAVIVQVTGQLNLCNIDDVRPHFDKFLANALTELVTDEDFAQAEAESKIGRETAKRCIATAKSVVDQTLTISEVTRELEQYAAKFNAVALQQEKAVKTQKEARKVSAKLERENAFREHVRSLNDEVKPIILVCPDPDFIGAMRNQRLLSSLYGKLDDALADGKIQADSIANQIKEKLNWYNNYVSATRFLFNDLQSIITNNDLEAFKSIVKCRVSDYVKELESAAEADRKRVQACEERKAEEKSANIIRDEADRVEAEIRRIDGGLVFGKKLSDYEKGALKAVSLMVHIHDCPVIAADVLREMGLQNADCSGLDEFDKKSLSKIYGELSGFIKIRGIKKYMLSI